MQIRSLVRNDFETIHPYDGTHTVKGSISQKHALVVMEEDKYIGVLTPDDLLSKSHNLIIDCLRTKPCTRPSHSILEVLDVMKSSHARVLPVHDSECFIGLIFYDDIMEYLSKIIEEQKSVIQIIAHDLKSPIASILGLASLLKDSIAEEDNIELVTLTEKACYYANDIISDLLLIPQLEGDQEEMGNLEIIEINSFLTECIASISVTANAKKVAIINEISVREYYLPVHRSKLQRAILNLLSNAIKFTPQQGSIWVSSTVNTSNNLLITIKDSGIGIPQSNQPFIFNKFTKSKRLGTNGERSTGLGLFITKQIIELHKGELSFNSDEQAGTTFYINFENARHTVAILQ